MAILAAIFDNKAKKTEINVPSQFIDELDENFREQAERQFLVMDATMSTTLSNEAQPTDHAIEEGSNITDHVDVKPKSVSFNGFISEAPIKLEAALIGNVAGIAGNAVASKLGNFGGSLVTGAIASLGGALLDDENRVLNAHNSFVELMAKKIPCTLVTGLQTYTNMVLTSYTPEETPTTGDSLSFSATFREMRIVSSQTVILTQESLDQSVKHTAGQHNNSGKQPATEPSSQAQGKGTSTLFDMGKWGGLVG